MRGVAICMALGVLALAGCRSDGDTQATEIAAPPVAPDTTTPADTPAVTGHTVTRFDAVDPATGTQLGRFVADATGAFTVSFPIRPADVAPDFPTPTGQAGEGLPLPPPLRDDCCAFFVGAADWNGEAQFFDFMVDFTTGEIRVPSRASDAAVFTVANAAAE